MTLIDVADFHISWKKARIKASKIHVEPKMAGRKLGILVGNHENIRKLNNVVFKTNKRWGDSSYIKVISEI